MNSEYGKKSLQDLKNQARNQMQAAAQVQPCVAVTEQNWKAMISLQQSQIEMLEQLQAVSKTLTTDEQIRDFLEQQLDILTKYAVKVNNLTVKMREEMEKTGAAFTEQTNLAVQNLSEQAGKMSESFGWNLSSVKDSMKKFTTKLCWISLIPTFILVIWEVMRHILRLT